MERKTNRALKWKVFLLLLVACCFLGFVVFGQYQSAREREAYEKRLLREKEKEEQQTAQKASEAQAQADALAKEEEGVEASGDVDGVAITNLSAFASPVMGMYDQELSAALKEWVTERELEAETAKILQAVIPADDPQVTEFYVRIEDAGRSLVKLVWHPRERVVTASESVYTQEEIEAEVWKDNGPLIRDLSPQEEESLPEPTGTDVEEGGLGS